MTKDFSGVLDPDQNQTKKTVLDLKHSDTSV